MKFHTVLNTATSALAVGAAFLAIPAFAQSTGSADFDGGAIIVTGARTTAVGGVDVPETPKAKVAITSELIQHQTPGQTINDMLNLVPGVSFTNNDPWGSLGGSFTVRGFGADRISQTLDGIPLNDSGNYALYTNQIVDPEVVDSVTVSLGSTDVDSPTASAAGGTINIRTITPSDDFGVLTSLSYGNIIARGKPGDRMMYRMFGMVQTGELTPFGTKAWFSAARTENDSVFSNYGGVDKQQYNGKIYQPIGDNGDFISIAGHYNQNRNNFNGSPTGFSASGWGIEKPEDRFYELFDGTPCTTDTPQTGVVDSYNSCGTPFERRYNPSNTGNLRLASLFHFTERLTFSLDGAFQYVKANGGGTSIGYEGASLDGATGGFFTTDSRNAARPTRSTQYYYFGGVDLNGDGDVLDYVNILSPSHTQTRRWTGIANLAWDINDSNRIRVAYTFDRARHRQTGTAGLLKMNGEPFDVFPINDPLLDVNGMAVQKRNRLSYAILHQASAEYRGSFLDDSLIVQIGARMPFFKRELNQFCVTTNGSGDVDCVNGESNIAAYLAANPTFVGPTSRDVKYDKLLPNLGVTFKFTPEFSVFASYAKNLSVPGTDALYGSVFSGLEPKPEVSDAFDVGARFQSGNVQAQVAGWFTKYDNRLASGYDPECDCTVTRNLGKVDKYGIDGNISWRPIPAVTFYVFGSYLKSEIKNDIVVGDSGCSASLEDVCYTATDGFSYVTTDGNREAGGPKYMYGARVQGTLGAVEAGFQVKRTGSRFLNDINTIAFPAYTVADFDIRYSLEGLGLDKSRLQLNVTNIFDEIGAGSCTSYGLTSSSCFVNILPPRAITASLIMGF
jgi:iron complex outermembrane receptor protein